NCPLSSPSGLLLQAYHPPLCSGRSLDLALINQKRQNPNCYVATLQLPSHQSLRFALTGKPPPFIQREELRSCPDRPQKAKSKLLHWYITTAPSSIPPVCPYRPTSSP